MMIPTLYINMCIVKYCYFCNTENMKGLVVLLVIMALLCLETQACKTKYKRCSSSSECCKTPKDYAGRTLRCLTQCDEGGCLPYKQCMYYAGIQ